MGRVKQDNSNEFAIMHIAKFWGKWESESLHFL
jgi:hypothetical protein